MSSFGRYVSSRKAPEPAELVLSQALPMSPSTSLAMTNSRSTMEAGLDASTFITKFGEKSPS